MKIIFAGKHIKHCFNILITDELYSITVDVQDGEFKLPIFKEPFAINIQENKTTLTFKNEQFVLTKSPLNIHLEEYQEMSSDCIYIDFIGTVQLD